MFFNEIDFANAIHGFYFLVTISEILAVVRNCFVLLLYSD